MLIKLIIGLLKIGTIGYGGGAAAMPLMKKEFVEKLNIISEEEFVEILAICNILPGPLITKYCAVLGYKVKGVIGATLAILALILPSAIMLIIILSFVKNANENENVTNMINCIFPVISVIMAKLTFDLVLMAKGKFKIIYLIGLITLFVILLVVFKISILFLIAGVILACFLTPKKEGE